VLLQRAPAHEQANMATWHGLPDDARLGHAEIVRGIKDLFGHHDIVGSAAQQVGRAGQVERSAQAKEFPPWRAGSP
jgi:hypothetical protein